MQWMNATEQVIFTGSLERIGEMHSSLAKMYMPNVVMMSGETAKGSFARSLPSTGEATAYYCREFVCELPIHDVESLLKLVRRTQRSLSNA
jgi:uncharacterized protein YyaL (SSP411 family)